MTEFEKELTDGSTVHSKVVTGPTFKSETTQISKGTLRPPMKNKERVQNDNRTGVLDGKRLELPLKYKRSSGEQY